jgi:predicted nucleic acid-binding protein
MTSRPVAADDAQIVYADTSGLYALLDATDGRHDQASTIVRSLLGDGAVLVTSNYVVAELTALVQGRLGLDAALRVHRALLPALEIVFVDRALHERAVAAWAAARRRGLSLVDCAGFELMRDLGIVTALAFDRHFEDQGFALP